MPRRSAAVAASGVLLAALALGASLAPAAHADSASEARFLVRRANSAFASARYLDALGAFLDAYRAAPDARILFNIGLCAAYANERTVAYDAFQRFLQREDMDPRLRAEAERQLSQLEPRLALIEITSDPPGAVVYVDQPELGPAGRAPLRISVEPGVHTLILRRAGFEEARIEVDAPQGEVRTIAATLEPILGELIVAESTGEGGLRVLDDEDAVVLEGFGRLEGRLPVGTYRVEAKLDAEVVLPRRVRVDANRAGRLALTLPPRPLPTGRLLVASDPLGLDVRIDGRQVGSTPLTLPQISTGAHEVEVVGPGGMRTETVEIEEGRGTLVRFDDLGS
ncbi:MAG: PEGA domain-containing protein [Sandaracinaceae bacterium]